MLVENEQKKLQKFDAAYFRGKTQFEEDGTQNCGFFFNQYTDILKGLQVLVVVIIYTFGNLKVSLMKVLILLLHSITPELSFYGTKTRVEFNGSCLKQDKVTYNHGTIVNIYIVYEISQNCSISSYPTSENCLFGAVSLTKNADIDQYKYFGYGIGFFRHGEFSCGNGLGRSCIIFGAEKSLE